MGTLNCWPVNAVALKGAVLLHTSLETMSRGSGWELCVPTRWVHGGVIPPCPCGAPSEDQVRRTSGADRVSWFCLICDHDRPAEPGWTDDLVALTDARWKAVGRAMERRRQSAARRLET